jgi:hypothetical protein
VVEHANEASSLKGKYPEFRQQLLLTNALPQLAGYLVARAISGLGFNDRFALVG